MTVSVITLPFRKTHLIAPVFDAILAQTHKDIELIAVINDSTDGSMDFIKQSYPQVTIIEMGYNALFAKGVNTGIWRSRGEYIQLVNDDLILESTYISTILTAFEDPHVGAATGKILRYDVASHCKTRVIDTTGQTLAASGRVRDRGQHQVDKKQFDQDTHVFGVSAAGAMYRRHALDKIKYKHEYFDEDFGMYWEDADVSWRLNNARFRNIYVPQALAYHGRTAGQSEAGYLAFFTLVKQRRELAFQIRQWDYKNHILMYIKNSKSIWHPAFIGRELALLTYLVVLERDTLKVVPQLIRQIPRILEKRQFARSGRRA